MTHTPGPWRIGRKPYFVAAGAKGRTSIAHCIWTGSDASQATNPSFEEAIANAHLIASAPELLAALENMVKVQGGEGEYDSELAYFEQARAAVAKAKGGSKCP
jgi:hypothetical protein